MYIQWLLPLSYIHVFMFIIRCCCSLLCCFLYLRYSLRFHPNLIVDISGFICYLCLLTHTGVQHDFHIRCHLAVTRPVPLFGVGPANPSDVPELTSVFCWIRCSVFSFIQQITVCSDVLFSFQHCTVCLSFYVYCSSL